jgi:hypothetical protein
MYFFENSILYRRSREATLKQDAGPSQIERPPGWHWAGVWPFCRRDLTRPRGEPDHMARAALSCAGAGRHFLNLETRMPEPACKCRIGRGGPDREDTAAGARARYARRRVRGLSRAHHCPHASARRDHCRRRAIWHPTRFCRRGSTHRHRPWCRVTRGSSRHPAKTDLPSGLAPRRSPRAQVRRQ